MGRIKGFDENQVKRRIELLSGEGECTAPEIAKELGISLPTVYKYRDKYEIEIKVGKRGRAPSEERNEKTDLLTEIAAFAGYGLSLYRISQKVKLPSSLVEVIARKHNIKIDGKKKETSVVL